MLNVEYPEATIMQALDIIRISPTADFVEVSSQPGSRITSSNSASVPSDTTLIGRFAHRQSCRTAFIASTNHPVGVNRGSVIRRSALHPALVRSPRRMFTDRK